MILLGFLIGRSHRDFLKMKKEVKRRKKLPFFDFCFGRLKTPLYLYQERSYIANSLGERVSEFIYLPFCQALLYSPKDLPFMSYSLSFKHYKRLTHAGSWSIPLLHGQPEDVHRDSGALRRVTPSSALSSNCLLTQAQSVPFLLKLGFLLT